MTRDESLFKIGISVDLQILGNFWDKVSAQLHEIYHTEQVVFKYFITKILAYCAFNYGKYSLMS